MLTFSSPLIRSKEDIYRATHRRTDCTQLPQQTRTLHSRILSHIIIHSHGSARLL